MSGEDISNLVDDELRCFIANELNLDPSFYYDEDNQTCLATLKKDDFDPCNNWNDLMPFVDKYGITYNTDTCQKHVTSYYYPKIKVSKGLHLFQRALAECLLLVLREENKS